MPLAFPGSVCFKLNAYEKNILISVCSYYLMICVLFLPAGCIRTAVRLDLDTYLQKQASYAGQDIVITASA